MVSLSGQTYHTIVGYYDDAGQKRHGFWYNDATQVFTDYDFPGASETKINKINDLGYLVGRYVKNNIPHGFLYDMKTNTAITIDFPGAADTEIQGLNNKNHLVGRYLASTGVWHGFVYDGQTFTTVDYPAAAETYCSDINDAGIIVGFYKIPTGKCFGFYYDGSTFTGIDRQGAKYVRTWDINNENLVVGDFMDKKNKIHGFYFAGGAFTIVDYPQAYHTLCGGINDAAVAVGAYVDTDADWQYGFKCAGAIFTAIDYPAAAATYAAGITDLCRDFPAIQSYTELHASADDPRITDTDGRLISAYYPAILYDPVKDREKPYRIWFSSPGSPIFIKFSRSIDGQVWDPPQPVTGLKNAHHVQVIYLSDIDKYRVYYWDTEQLYSIAALRTAKSTEGIEWSSDKPIAQSSSQPLITGISPDFNRGSYGPVAVFYNPHPTAFVSGASSQNPRDYRMALFYDCTTGGQQIVSLAVSNDGVNFCQWHLLHGESTAQPVISLGSAADWDSSYVTHGAIFPSSEEPGKWYFYYSGGRNAAHEGIGMAYSTDHGVTWTKYESNPIVSINDGVWWRSSRCYTPAVIYTINGKCLGADRLFKIWLTGDNGSSRGLGCLFLQ